MKGHTTMPVPNPRIILPEFVERFSKWSNRKAWWTNFLKCGNKFFRHLGGLDSRTYNVANWVQHFAPRAQSFLDPECRVFIYESGAWISNLQTGQLNLDFIEVIAMWIAKGIRVRMKLQGIPLAGVRAIRRAILEQAEVYAQSAAVSSYVKKYVPAGIVNPLHFLKVEFMTMGIESVYRDGAHFTIISKMIDLNPNAGLDEDSERIRQSIGWLERVHFAESTGSPNAHTCEFIEPPRRGQVDEPRIYELMELWEKLEAADPDDVDESTVEVMCTLGKS